MTQRDSASFVWLGLAGVAVLAAGLARLTGLGFTEMWGDQSQEIAGALAWLNGGEWPLVAMKSSYGLYNPPLVRYLYAVPLALGLGVTGVAALTAWLNTLGVVALAVGVGRVWGARAAFWAVMVLAFNPWAVHFSKLIWMQTTAPFFASLALMCALWLWADDTPRGWPVVVGLVALAGAVQVHLTSAVVGAALMVAALVVPPRLSWRALAWGVALAGLMFVPYLLFQLQNNWVDVRTLLSGSGTPYQINASAVLLFFDLFQAKGVYATAGASAGVWQAADPLGGGADALVAMTLTAALVAALGHGVAVARRAPRAQWPPQVRGLVVVLAWLVVPALLFVRHNHYLQNYYFLYWLPAGAALVAAAAEMTYRAWRARGGSPMWAGLCFVPLAVWAAHQASTTAIGQGVQAQGLAGQQRVMDVQQLVDTSRALLATRPGCSLVVVSEAASALSSRVGLLRGFITTAPVRFVQAGAAMLLPPTCAVYGLVADHAPTATWLADHTAPLPAATVRTPEQTWLFFDMPAPARTALAERVLTAPPLAQWQEGMYLHQMHTTALRPGEPLAITTTWSIAAPLANQAQPVQAGHYVLGPAGDLVAQADGLGLEANDWRTGDVFELYASPPMPAEAPAGDYTLAVAFYRYPEVQRLLLADGSDLARVAVVVLAR